MNIICRYINKHILHNTKVYSLLILKQHVIEQIYMNYCLQILH